MAAPSPVRMAVSGGIGSGKSAAGAMLAERGFLVIDADRVGHSLLEAGHPVAERVAARWPRAAMADRGVDRGILGGIVFADPEQLRELEEMTHPEIGRIIRERAAGAGESPVAAELPIPGDLLGEGWLRVVVDAPEATRRARLLERGMTGEDIDRRMAVQPTRAQWRSVADCLLPNHEDLPALAGEVDRLLARLGSA